MTQETKLKRLERKSHYMLDKPSVTLKKGNLYFSSSAVDILEISKFSHCYISIPESSTPESAIDIYVEFNNDPASVTNSPSKLGKNGVGANVSQLGTVFNQLNNVKALLSKKRNERRIFLEKDNSNNKWFFRVGPQPSLKIRDFSKIEECSALYILSIKGTTTRIGETSNLKRRITEYKREEIPFDEVIYCRMDNFSDDERKSWETYHLDRYVREKGVLPPYNFQNGKQIN